MHLGMSGRFTVYAKGHVYMPGEFAEDAPPAEAGTGKHDHVVFETDAHARIVYTDHRRFGLMLLTKTADARQAPVVQGAGARTARRRFHARSSLGRAEGEEDADQGGPPRSARGRGPRQYLCVRGAVRGRHFAQAHGVAPWPARAPRVWCPRSRSVLKDAIAAGGSTLRDYAKTDGGLGYFQHRFKVYDREGKRCPKPGCKGTVKRIVQSGRSTFYCPSCQR